MDARAHTSGKGICSLIVVAKNQGLADFIYGKSSRLISLQIIVLHVGTCARVNPDTCMYMYTCVFVGARVRACVRACAHE